MTDRKCTVCNCVKPFAEFRKDRLRPHKNGSTYVDRTFVCNVCLYDKTKTPNKRWRERNKEYVKRLYMLCDARKRAKKHGREFNIEVEDIVIPDVCPLLNIPLDKEATKAGGSPNSPSLDRKDATKGYVKGNVWVISHKANTLKSNATAEELKLLADNLMKHKETT